MRLRSRLRFILINFKFKFKKQSTVCHVTKGNVGNKKTLEDALVHLIITGKCFITYKMGEIVGKLSIEVVLRKKSYDN